MLLMLLLQVLACCLCYFTSAHAQVQVVPPVTLRPSFGAHNQRVSVLAYSPDGRYLASGSWDRVVKIWCNNEEQDEMELVGHLGAITALAWNVNSTLLVSGSSDQTLRIWDVRSGKPVHVLSDVHQTISAIDWHPHSNEIAFGTGDGRSKILDIRSVPMTDQPTLVYWSQSAGYYVALYLLDRFL